MLAFVTDRLTAPKRGEHVESLIEHIAASSHVGLVPEGGIFGYELSTEADPQDQATAAQMVKCEGLAGELDDISAR